MNFLNSVRYRPIYTCVCCHRIRFKKSIIIYNQEVVEDILHKSKKENIVSESIGDIPDELLVKDNDGNYNNYLCKDCHHKLKSGRIPSMSHTNNLGLFDLNGREELNLTELENALVARNILFQMFVQLPNSRWSGLKKQIISVPIFEQDVENTLNSLPRTPDQASICKVQLKRKKSMKNSHMDQYILVNKMINAIQTFKDLGNKHYDNIVIPESYADVVRTEDPNGYNLLFPEESDLLSDSFDKINKEAHEDTHEDKHDDLSCKEDDNYLKEDPIQKWKFNYDEKTTYVEDYPEMNVYDQITNDEQVSEEPVRVAPGEGKRPENILKFDNWDTSSFPNLHPDGNNGLHEKRNYKLTDPQ